MLIINFNNEYNGIYMNKSAKNITKLQNQYKNKINITDIYPRFESELAKEDNQETKIDRKGRINSQEYLNYKYKTKLGNKFLSKSKENNKYLVLRRPKQRTLKCQETQFNKIKKHYLGNLLENNDKERDIIKSYLRSMSNVDLKRSLRKDVDLKSTYTKINYTPYSCVQNKFLLFKKNGSSIFNINQLNKTKKLLDINKSKICLKIQPHEHFVKSNTKQRLPLISCSNKTIKSTKNDEVLPSHTTEIKEKELSKRPNNNPAKLQKSKVKDNLQLISKSGNFYSSLQISNNNPLFQINPRISFNSLIKDSDIMFSMFQSNFSNKYSNIKFIN